jgi:hypothetical protein
LSAFFITVDIILAAVVWTTIMPLLDPATANAVVVIGVVVIMWKLARDFYWE